MNLYYNKKTDKVCFTCDLCRGETEEVKNDDLEIFVDEIENKGWWIDEHQTVCKECVDHMKKEFNNLNK